MAQLATRGEADVVRALITALQRADVEAALDLVHDDVVFHPYPLPSVRGKPALARQLALIALLVKNISIGTQNIASNGHVVLTERTHSFDVGPVPIEFWTWGTFEVVDGRITLWRERLDIAELSLSALKGIAQASLQIESRRGQTP